MIEMNEDPKVTEHIGDSQELPDACAETLQSAKSTAPEPGSSIGPEEIERLTNAMVAAIKTVYDPEIPVDIYELGLIYKIDVDDDRNVEVDMTLTAPGLPGRRRNADLGGKCRRQCRWYRPRQGQSRF